MIYPHCQLMPVLPIIENILSTSSRLLSLVSNTNTPINMALRMIIKNGYPNPVQMENRRKSNPRLVASLTTPKSKAIRAQNNQFKAVTVRFDD